MRKFLLIAALAAASLSTNINANAAAPVHSPPAAASQPAAAPSVDAVRAALRDLWVGHIFWVRNVVVFALAGNTAAQKASEQQVVANAHAIAASIEPFYGPAAQQKLFALLAGHYGAIKAYLDASIANNPRKQSEATNALLHNAAEIAVFLSTANPNLPRSTVETLFDAHGGHHIMQIQQLKARNYTGEAKSWSEMTQQIYVISDALVNAIAKQFPNKFQPAE